MGFGDLLQQKCRSPAFASVRNYAARKGYREAAKKKKVKTVIQKQGWIPHNLRKKDVEEFSGVKRSDEHTKRVASDDVWVTRSYAWRIFDFKEAVECHRETHHPTIYNVPDAQINLFIELNMTTAKPTKFVEKFRKMAILPHVYEQDGLQERSILVFCKTPEQKEAARAAGANLVGGTEIIKDIEKGKVVLPDFRFILAHPTILPEMVTIRGLLKKKFPNVKSGRQTVTIVHKVLDTGRPVYLNKRLMLRSAVRERHTRQDAMLQLPRVHLERGKRGFSYFGPKEYNALPPAVKTLPLRSFKRKLKEINLSY
ncbi:mitochondrial 54S ribosomal protein mrpl1 [Homalodisca vitripennis]|nr:mitochondrial 54S ribosomal protein mrpl1 [Homalodisca vitripennis]